MTTHARCIQMDCDDAANSVIVSVWGEDNLIEQHVFDTGTAKRNIEKAVHRANRMSRKYGIEWESN